MHTVVYTQERSCYHHIFPPFPRTSEILPDNPDNRASVCYLDDTKTSYGARTMMRWTTRTRTMVLRRPYAWKTSACVPNGGGRRTTTRRGRRRHGATTTRRTEVSGPGRSVATTCRRSPVPPNARACYGGAAAARTTVTRTRGCGATKMRTPSCTYHRADVRADFSAHLRPSPFSSHLPRPRPSSPRVPGPRRPCPQAYTVFFYLLFLQGNGAALLGSMSAANRSRSVSSYTREDDDIETRSSSCPTTTVAPPAGEEDGLGVAVVASSSYGGWQLMSRRRIRGWVRTTNSIATTRRRT